MKRDRTCVIHWVSLVTKRFYLVARGTTFDSISGALLSSSSLMIERAARRWIILPVLMFEEELLMTLVMVSPFLKNPSKLTVVSNKSLLVTIVKTLTLVKSQKRESKILYLDLLIIGGNIVGAFKLSFNNPQLNVTAWRGEKILMKCRSNFGWIGSPGMQNSANPFPALANPLITLWDTENPTPIVKKRRLVTFLIVVIISSLLEISPSYKIRFKEGF